MVKGLISPHIGESVHRAGVRKLIMVNSHGGNVDVISIVARELRVRLNMLAVACQWSRFGSPPGLYTAEENAVGIHAGDMETSMMLHFRPDLVNMGKAQNFAPTTRATAEKGKLTAEFRARAFAQLLADVETFSLSRLA